MRRSRFFEASRAARWLPIRPSLFERAIDALPDGVLLTGESRNVIYANRAFAHLWRIPEKLLQTRDEARMLQFVSDQLVDPGAFYREVERLHPTSENSEDELHFKDGRIFSRRSVPFQQDGTFEARIWIFTDITEARSASMDALTGLPNRRAYSRDFPGYTTAPDDGLLRSVAIMDVDNFKSYNDRYGHAAGDTVLRCMGDILRSHLDEADDMIFRVGGEEFLIAVRGRGEVDALAFFEALRLGVAGMEIAHLGNPPHEVVTASFGLGSFRSPKDPAAVFRNVDAALYRAKALGRNMISLADL